MPNANIAQYKNIFNNTEEIIQKTKFGLLFHDPDSTV